MNLNLRAVIKIMQYYYGRKNQETEVNGIQPIPRRLDSKFFLKGILGGFSTALWL
jgi:hypothetical protein